MRKSYYRTRLLTVCVICADFDAYPNRPTCAHCDPDDAIRFKTDPRVSACQTAYRLGGWVAVRELLGVDPDAPLPMKILP